MTSTRRGRPPHPDVLTPAEWRVAEGVREGRTYAEIADELGVSVNTVRYHVANIFAKLGLTSRRELEQWDGQPRRRRKWALAVAALGWRGAAVGVAGVAFVAVVAMTFAMLSGGGSGEEQPATREFRDMAEYTMLTVHELSALGFVDMGPLFRSEDDAPFESMVRAGFTMVRTPAGGFRLAEAGWIQGWSFPRMESVITNRLGARLSRGGHTYHVVVWAMHLDRYGFGGVSSCLLYTGTERGGMEVEWLDVDDEFAVRTLESDEVVLGACDDSGGPYLSAVDADGHLWLAPRSESLAAIAADTGEALDVARMTQIGVWRPGQDAWFATWCYRTDPDSRCVASSGGFGTATTPFDATLSCEAHPEHGENRFLLSNEQWTLELIPIGIGLTCPDSLPRDLRAGDLLPRSAPNWVILNARDSVGNTVDVVVDHDGRLFVGDAQTRLACPPCLAGN